MGERKISLDILRTFSVVAALWMHANYRLCLAGNEYAYGFTRNVAQVGYVFAFVGGFVAAFRYLDRFKLNPTKVSFGLVKKGGFLLGISMGYALLMYRLDGTYFEGWWNLFFFHPYTNRVLTIFGLMYLSLPLILWGLGRSKKTVMAILMILVMILGGRWLLAVVPLGTRWLVLVADSGNNMYPMIYMLVMYLTGMIFGWWEKEIYPHRDLRNRRIILSLALGLVWLLQGVVMRTMNRWPEAQLLYRGIIMAALVYWMDQWTDLVSRRRIAGWLTLPGRESLTFFVAGNFFVDLIEVMCDADYASRTIKMLTVMIFAYGVSCFISQSKGLTATGMKIRVERPRNNACKVGPGKKPSTGQPLGEEAVE